MENILEYDDFIYERKSLSDDEREEMSSFGERGTGIPNVSFWVGPNKMFKNPIVKISNILNEKSGIDCFTIVLPDLNIIGNRNKNTITDEILDKIKKFITINKNLIYDISNEKIRSLDFFKKIKKYNDL